MTDRLTINTRRATPKDRETLVDFNLAMAHETEHKALDRAVVDEGVRAVFADPRRGFYLLAECGDTVAGGLLVTTEWSDWRNADFWWIQSVYVRPEYRRRGVYRILHEYIRDMARKDDRVCGLRLYVDSENARAKTVYRRLGMRQTRYEFFEEDFTSND